MKFETLSRRSKQLLTVVLAVFMLFGHVTQVFSQEQKFSDIPLNHWAAEYIYELSDLGVTTGYQDGTYKPNNNIIRAESSVMIVRALKLETTNRQSSFFDVSQNHWAYSSISAASEESIFKGNNGYFYPNNNITRAEMAAVLYRSFNVELGPEIKSFSDISSRHWAYNEINSLASNKIINGYQDNTFRANNPITRAEFAAMLVRALNYVKVRDAKVYLNSHINMTQQFLDKLFVSEDGSDVFTTDLWIDQEKYNTAVEEIRIATEVLNNPNVTLVEVTDTTQNIINILIFLQSYANPGTKINGTLQLIDSVTQEIPYTSVTRYYVSEDELNSLSDQNKLDSKLAEYNNLNYPKNEDLLYIEQEGVLGQETIETYAYVDDSGEIILGYDPIIKVIENKPAIQEKLIALGFSHTTGAVDFDTSYIADETMLVDNSKIVRAGQHGVDMTLTHASGYKIIHRYENPVTQVIAMGVLKEESVSIPYQKEVKYDPNLWDKYKEVTQVGVNGTQIDTYKGTFNPIDQTVDFTNSTFVSSRVAVEPISEITTIGTKVPEFKVVESKENPVAFETTTKVYVSQSELQSLSTLEEINAKITEFNSYPLVSENSQFRIIVVGKEGIDRVERWAYVDENGNEITEFSYPSTTFTSRIKEPVTQELAYLGFSVTKTSIPYSTVYVANDNLEVGQTNVLTQGVDGKLDTFTHEDGYSVSHTSLEAINQVVEVGTRKEFNEVVKFEIEEIPATPWPQALADPLSTAVAGTGYKLINNGVDGYDHRTVIYNLNTETGELTTIKSEVDHGSIPVINEKRQVPTNQVYGRFDKAFADELFRLINEYRAQNGLTQLVQANSQIQAFANMRLATLANYPQTTAHYYQYDNNLAFGYQTPAATLEGWKTSLGHNANLLRALPEGTIAVVAANIGTRRGYSNFISYGYYADNDLRVDLNSGIIWDLDYIYGGTFDNK